LTWVANYALGDSHSSQH